MTKYDAKWRADALRECWEKQLTPLECAQYIGVTRAQIYAIFAGREWKSIPRPEGFVYPFPSLPKPRKLTADDKAAYLRRYVEDHQTPDEFAAMVGVNRESAYHVLKGFGWKDIERPPGFHYPWPDRNWSRKPKTERQSWSRRASK